MGTYVIDGSAQRLCIASALTLDYMITVLTNLKIRLILDGETIPFSQIQVERFDPESVPPFGLPAPRQYHFCSQQDLQEGQHTVKVVRYTGFFELSSVELEFLVEDGSITDITYSS